MGADVNVKVAKVAPLRGRWNGGLKSNMRLRVDKRYLGWVGQAASLRAVKAVQILTLKTDASKRSLPELRDEWSLLRL